MNIKNRSFVTINVDEELDLKIIKNIKKVEDLPRKFDAIILGCKDQLINEKKLDDMGLVRFKDYFCIQEILKLLNKKKLCLLLGSCILYDVDKMIRNSNVFMDEYEIIYKDVDTVEELSLNFNYPDELLSNVDLLLYTFDNSKYRMSNDNVMSKLNKTCKKLSISGCIFSGYFPQTNLGKNEMNPYGYEDYINKIFICELKDNNIDKMICAGESIDKIIYKLEDVNYYSKLFLDEWFDKSLRFLKISELNCDIKVYDFVKNNYKNDLLYRSSEHPTSIIIKEICNQIINFLNINDKKFLSDKVTNVTIDMPIYPSVLKYLGISKDNVKISLCNKKTKKIDYVTFEGYINAYYNLYLDYKERTNKNNE